MRASSSYPQTTQLPHASFCGELNPEHAYVKETKDAIANGEPMGTETTYNLSNDEKKSLEESQGIPDSDGTIVVHEMQHQFDYEQGNMADSQGKKGADSPTEQRAVKNENRVRKQEGLPKRTTYGGVKIDPKKL